MTLIQSQPSALCFSSDIGDVVFSTGAVNGVVRLCVRHTDGNGTEHEETVLEETMYPSADGNVAVRDLSPLVEPYARQYQQVTLECTFTDTDGTAGITPVTVLYGMVDVDTTAEDFCRHHFLTTLDGEKMTAMGCRERLYVYDTEVPAAIVRANTLTADGMMALRTAELQPVMSVCGVSQYDVSPDAVLSLLDVDGGEALMAYTVAVGQRYQDFCIAGERCRACPSLLFTNSFGCQEFLHCTGTLKEEPKFERKSARILGRLRNYSVREERQFKANTGWLCEAMAKWADELMRSYEVYLWTDGAMGREVVITDSKSERSNEDDAQTAFELTYVYAQRIHNVMADSHAGRLFGEHFEYTFN